MKRILGAALALIYFAANATAATPSPPSPLPGEETYFRAPDMAMPLVSPDGKNVAFIANQNGHARLFRLDLATGALGGVFDPGQGEVIHYWWLDGQRMLVAGLGQKGRQYFLQNITAGAPREITTLLGIPPAWVWTLPADPNHVAVIKWGELSRWFYGTHLDVNTGKGEPFDRDVRDLASAVITSAGEIRAKAYRENDRWHVLWRTTGTGGWQQAENADAWPSFWPLAMAKDDQHILVLAYDQGETTALMQLDPATGARTLLAQRPDRDIFRIVNAGQAHQPVGVSFFNPGHDDLQLLDDSLTQTLGRIANSLPETYKRIASRSTNGEAQVIEAWNPGLPASYYLLEPARGRMSKLGQQYTAETLPALGTVRFFNFTTRDGQTESGYILLPPDTKGKGPHPALLFPIDYIGQEGDQSYNFDGLEQFLASRGIAVIRIMVRGSRGLGKTFLEAGEFKLADTVTHDYEDGLAYLAHEGLVDAQRVAIFGRGRTALLALRMASVSAVFKAVIAREAAAGNLGSWDVDWLTGSNGSEDRMLSQAGGRESAASMIGQFDPMHFIDKLQAHALIIYQSDYDREYHLADASHLRGAFQKFNKPHEWYFFDTHDFDRRKDAYYQAVIGNKIASYLEQQFAGLPPRTK